MQIVEFRQNLLPSLTRLINEQIAAVPPGCILSDVQVAQMIAQGGALWDIHYPEDHAQYGTRTVCALEHGEVVAAAQWLLPKNSKLGCWILWLVAQPDHPLPLRTLLHLIDKQAEMSGGGTIGQTRCSLGVGWFGVPATWTHVVQAMLDTGYQQTEKWVLMTGETEIHTTIALPQIDNLRFYWNMNKPVLEWGLTAYQGEIQVGECQIWGIPFHLEECAGLSEWTTVEWVDVSSDYRQRGIGKRLLLEQMRFHSRRGIKHFIVWAKDDNLAVRRLNESLGFVRHMELAVMQKS